MEFSFITLEQYLSTLYPPGTSGELLAYVKKPFIREFGSPHDLTTFANKIRELNSQKHTVYLTINTLDGKAVRARGTHTRGNEEEVVSVVGLVADADAGEKEGHCYPSREAVLSAVDLMPFKPSIIVSSGKEDGGVHVYWLFDKPLFIADDDFRKRVKRCSHEWQKLLAKKLEPCELDPTHDLVRVLRPIETTNHKYGKQVSLLKFDPTYRHKLEDFEKFIPPVPKPGSLASIDSGDDATSKAIAYVNGVPGCDGGSGRDKTTMKVARALTVGFGLSVSQSLPIITQWNQKCKPNTYSADRIEKLLIKKLRDADKSPDQRGMMLNGYSDVDLAKFFANIENSIDVPAFIENEDSKNNSFPTECIETMPYTMRLAYEYSIKTSIKPQPELTLAALIALFGAVYGRKVMDDYGTRTNIMVLGLAPSGAGKEHPRQVNKEILYHSGLELVSGPERLGSHAGIVTSMFQHPVRLFQLDEIGRLLVTMKDPGHSPYLYNIGSVLMQLYSSANQSWTGDAYADASKVKRIIQPCVCVYGTSIAETFYSSISSENLRDGLLGRLIVFQAGGYGTRKKPHTLKQPPLEVIEIIKSLEKIGGGENLHTEFPDPLFVQKTHEADVMHEEYCEIVHQKHSDEDDMAAAVWARAPEKEAKLALIYACCDSPDVREANITGNAIRWAKKLVNYATRVVLQNSSNVISDSKYEEQKKRLWRKLRDGMTAHELSRKTQWLRDKERREIVDDLKSCGAISIEEIATATNKKTVIKKTRITI